ncbi:hypothetical protein BGZ61DRAFT_440636 [Ilyonectria robusta]|uniref:uncharacterized protein n=1 Tax=Ilyonectria robusta TaxID=1079257 RepID=UPI001E8D04A0|nr:uncharacterized protein BGZ61DRAFT_440636 [Ilyonectria robusta]KAH8735649.1 hypothetical protein BGZ61DRAFT_440636 [Ilyonectria robusta]
MLLWNCRLVLVSSVLSICYSPLVQGKWSLNAIQSERRRGREKETPRDSARPGRAEHSFPVACEAAPLSILAGHYNRWVVWSARCVRRQLLNEPPHGHAS